MTWVTSLRSVGLLSRMKLNTCSSIWMSCPVIYIYLRMAKIVESLWLRGSWRAKFSFPFAGVKGEVILGNSLFLFFACLHTIWRFALLEKHFSPFFFNQCSWTVFHSLLIFSICFLNSCPFYYNHVIFYHFSLRRNMEFE